MNQANLIHIHKERQMEPFWWIATFTAHTIGLLLGVTFITAPIILFFIFHKYWILIFLILLPVGFWMIKALLGSLKELIWKNRHTSTYSLQKDSIDFKTWNLQTKQLQEEAFSLRSIDYVVSAMYLLGNNHVYTKSKVTERVQQTVLVPILYIVYSKNGEKQLLTVPFYDDPAINTWIRTFQEENIRLYYTDLLLNTANEEDRLTHLEKNEKLLPFVFENDWFVQSIALSRQWNGAFAEKSNNEQSSGANESNVKIENKDKSKARKKLLFKKWLPIALITYALLVVGIYLTVILAEKGIISEASLVPGMILLAITSFIYFFMLKTYVYWKYIVRFCIESFIIIIIAFIALFERGIIAEEMLTSIISSSLLFVFVSWVPYLLVSFINKNRKKS